MREPKLEMSNSFCWLTAAYEIFIGVSTEYLRNEEPLPFAATSSHQCEQFATEHRRVEVSVLLLPAGQLRET